mgnify:CR=1 FL=1
MADDFDLSEMPIGEGKVKPYNEYGSSGLQHSGGFIYDEFVSELRGILGAKVFREMSDNDPVIGSMLFAIERLIIQIDWRVNPFKDDDKSTKADEDAAKFVESCMYDMSDSWETTLSGILTFLTYGYSFCEIVYKKRGGRDTDDPTKKSAFKDGKIGWRKIALRAQETTWEWILEERTGEILGMIQSDPSSQNTIPIPIAKALLFRASSARNNPEGKSMIRNAWRPWRFKKSIEEIEAIGMERDLAGMPVAYVPPSYLSSTATAAEVLALAAIVKLVRGVKRNTNEGIVFPLAYDANNNQLFKLELMNAGGLRQFDSDKIISRYDQRIAMTMLADFILLGHENVGSFALGSSKIDLFTTAIAQIAKSIAETFNQHAIPRLLKLNGMDTSRQPEITFGEISHVDLALLGEFISKTSASGALVIDDTLDEYLRLVSGLPERDPNSTEGVPMIPNNAAAQPPKPATDATQTATPAPEKPEATVKPVVKPDGK